MTKPYLGTVGAKRADVILKELGNTYRYQMIDGETCIYKQINNSYDIEISGTCTRRYDLEMTVSLWKLESNHTGERIETVSNVKTIEQLKNTLKTFHTNVREGNYTPVST